uniref:hypothetical protein n=1 Tax=Porphyridium aerugineum TaxID=2792 RepID=UPI001FCE0FC5|nr:hypothetical protein MW505_pgp060 [Porphyridium aerugineum]UNJ17937.1 hypothetical protein [Porphyridium aerugineum]
MINIANDISYFLINHEQIFIYEIFTKKYYFSTREFELIKNNLAWNQFIKKYIEETYNIYENKIIIYCLDSSSNIQKKYIRIQRISEFINLLSIQYIIALIIEIKDFIFPKIFIIISYIGQLIIFIIKNIIAIKKHNKYY